MLELAADLVPRLRAGERLAVVTVTAVARSAPRGTGASMAVTGAGDVIGSISGGCVETDAVALAHEARLSGAGRTARFGFSDATAHAAGLACGGEIEVVAYPLDSGDAIAMAALDGALNDEQVTVSLVVRGPDAGTFRAASDADPRDDALLTLSHAPRPRLLVLGAGDYAAALCRTASTAGYAVTVCDAWELLVTRARFPDAADLVAAIPAHYLVAEAAAGRLDSRSVVCVLTHDERLDVPALEVALRLPVAFVGALGARRTVARRADLLLRRGLNHLELERLHSPLGLDLGATTPEETAISILAEVVAARRGGPGTPLRDSPTPIHRNERRGNHPDKLRDEQRSERRGAAPGTAAGSACGIAEPAR
ncbi:XdhC family protein [Micromonospora sp. DT81.3]|uniref:XdhC family protein n=1 Tax=Micromonospora sp. DT81.3 TaxID=3416523 RepID=UPI003CF91F99